MKKLTIEDFIKKSKMVHGNKYDYSLVNYVSGKIPVKTICPIHGEFDQRPENHLYGFGCKYCGNNIKNTNEQFIEKAKKVHGDKYNYSEVDYKNTDKKIKIICPIHGEFNQTPYKHLNGQGCPKCKGGIGLTYKDFVEKSKCVHGNKYDYSLVNYINSKNNVKIICPIHGEFEQNPQSHYLLSYGCPACNESKGERKIRNILIKNDIYFISQYKFENCKYKLKLYFDFYLPDYNTCIEYDGEQHSTMYRFEKDDKKLKIRILRDNIKNKYCEENNIYLLRINHKDNIIEKMNDLFKKLKINI